MTEKESVWNAILRQPLAIAVLLLTVVIIVIYLDYRSQHTAGNGANMAMNGNTSAPMGGSTFMPKPPNMANAGQNMPQIVQDMGGASPNAAPNLGGLLKGLEDKVAANPNDVGKRILLAQTYRELGKADESMKTLQKLREDFPDNVRVKLVTASVLSQQDGEKDLKQALSLLKELSSVKDDDNVKPYLLNMYEGDAYIRLKDHKGALEKWKQALATMPPSDTRYKMLQDRIDSISNGKKNISAGG